MKSVKQVSVLSLFSLLLVLLFRRPVFKSLWITHEGWRTSPTKMTTKIIFSFVTGQGAFWWIGYDQLGFFMSPKIQLGFGRRVASLAYERIPHTASAAWGVKAAEILADMGKIPIEGALYRRHGFTPDGVAAAVSQPLWSVLETAEKVTGVVLYPERVNQPDQIKLSLGCIYGSLFRYIAAGFLWLFGPRIYKVIGNPVERALDVKLRRNES